jgi:hypothetical protein
MILMTRGIGAADIAKLKANNIHTIVVSLQLILSLKMSG